MTKTTIDGLARRQSPKGRVSSGVQVSRSGAVLKRRTVSDSVNSAKKRQATQGTTTKRTVSTVKTSSIRKNTQMTSARKVSAPQRKTTPKLKPRRDAAEDFLAPVESFMQKPSPNDQDTDWSKLLDGINQEKKAELGIADKEPKDEVDEIDEWLSEDDFKKKSKRQERKAEKSKKPKKSLKKKIGLIIGLIIIVLIGAVFVWGDQLISRLTGGRSGIFSTIASLVSDTPEFPMDENGRTNFLIFGTEGYDMSGYTNSGEHEGSQLTDSILILSLDQNTKDIAMVSLPRDLKVNGACMVGKVNEVFMCNNMDGEDEEAGAKALEEAVGEVFGIDFHYYAHVNWASLIQIIDAIGGITVTMDEDIDDYYYTGMVARAGETIELNGDRAVALARARYGTTGGDFTRANSQQKIMIGIIQKIMGNGIDLVTAMNLLNIFGDNLRTDVAVEYVKTGVKFLSDFSINNMRQVLLVDYDNNIFYVTNAMIDGISYVVPSAGVNNYREIQEYIDREFSSDPAVREGAILSVYNASGATGIAGQARDELTEAGYKVAEIGDAASEDCDVQYCIFDVSNGDKTGTRAALEQKYQTTARSSADLPADLNSYGVDFIIVLGPVPEVTSDES